MRFKYQMIYGIVKVFLAQTRETLKNLCHDSVVVSVICDVRTSVQTKHQRKITKSRWCEASESMAASRKSIGVHRTQKSARNSHISLPWLWWFSNSCHFIFALTSRCGTSLGIKTKAHFVQTFVVSHFSFSNSFIWILVLHWLFKCPTDNDCVHTIEKTAITTCSLWASSSSHQKHASRCYEWHDNILDECRHMEKWGFFLVLFASFRLFRKRQNCKHK